MDNKPSVLMIVTSDTKRAEGDYVRHKLEGAGLNVIHLDASIRLQEKSPAEIPPELVAAAAGTTVEDIRALKHEGKCLDQMIRGAVICARELAAQGKIKGVIGIGGSMGTSLACAVMRALPFGMPKVMVSTMASGMTRPFVGTKDIMMVPSVADIAGINKITGRVFANAAAALAGPVLADWQETGEDHPLVLMTTLGTTESCARKIRESLQDNGIEVVIFHSSGAGGQTFDELASEQAVDAVIDLSLSEINDLLNDGLCSAGPDRCRPAIRRGIPTIFAPGNVDFIIAGPIDAARQQFPGKRYHIHNPALTAVRTEEPELRKLAHHMADVISEGQGPVSFFVPLEGFSAHDSDQGHIQDKSQPPILAQLLQESLPERVDLQTLPCHINDAAFAEAITARVMLYLHPRLRSKEILTGSRNDIQAIRH